LSGMQQSKKGIAPGVGRMRPAAAIIVLFLILFSVSFFKRSPYKQCPRWDIVCKSPARSAT
jgi:hypothetical protein